MRPLFALLLSASILGAVQGYLTFQRGLHAQAPPTQPSAPANSDIELTFELDVAAAPEPFQLHPAALEIWRVGGERPVVRHATEVPPGQAISVPAYGLRPGVHHLRVVIWLAESERPPAEATIQLRWEKQGEAFGEQSMPLRVDGLKAVGELELEAP